MRGNRGRSLRDTLEFGAVFPESGPHKKVCLGPTWLAEGAHSFKACPPYFVCDDPECTDHTWTDEDRVLLRELRVNRETLFKTHSEMKKAYAHSNQKLNQVKVKAALAAFLQANSRLYLFVVRKAVGRSV